MPRDNFTSCLDACAELALHDGPCTAVVYAFATDKMCWLVNHTLNASTPLKEDNNTHTAWVTDLSIFTNADPSCPYTNLTTRTTPNNLTFEVYCDSDANPYNLVPGSSINGSDIQAYKHTSTLDECIAYCSTMRPKCFGVAFSPAMEVGYWNCYPKTSGAVSNFGASPYGHFALAQFDTEFNSSCDAGEFTTSDQKTTFNVTCKARGNGTAISSHYEANFAGCMDSCASYEPKGQGEKCAAVLYEYDGANGYENCYLMADAAWNSSRETWQLAQVLTSTTSGGSNSNDTDTSPSSGSSNTSSSSSKAWIAGPVIGVLAVIAIVAGVFFCIRKRRSNRQDTYQKQPIMGGELDSKQRNGELDANFTERKELDGTRRLVEGRRRGEVGELPG